MHVERVAVWACEHALGLASASAESRRIGTKAAALR